MTHARIALPIVLAIALLTAGCAVATVRVRQDDGTYRTTEELVWWSPDSYRSFECSDDYMVATELLEVTYEWPTGKGRLEDTETVTFEADGISCEVRKRTMTVNDRVYGEFAKGDHVRLTPDGRVLVNGAEQPAREDG